MAKKLPPGSTAALVANDDIGEKLRLRMYRMQAEIREAEQRAYDLFLQNLVKGTSHLSLGQEAVATGFACAMQPGDLSFCTYRGHAHTLARGVPIEAVLGELMQRDNGLMRGKGGSMHLTSVKHHMMGSYAIIGAHMTIARGFEAKLNIGERNIEATKAKAVEVGIRFRGEDVGGAHGRTVRLSAATGKVTISNVGGATYEL